MSQEIESTVFLVFNFLRNQYVKCVGELNESSQICSKLYAACANVRPLSLLCVLIRISIYFLYLATSVQLSYLKSILLSFTLLRPNFLCHVLHSGLLAKRCAFLISLLACYVSCLSPFFDWTGLIIHLLVLKITN